MKLILFVLILFFAGFTYLVVRLTNNEIADIRSRGAVTGTHETENGSVAGNASITNDTSASNGKYVLLSSSNPTPTPTGPLPTAHPGTWQLVGTHPRASLQSTTHGKKIHTVYAWKGRVYMGYGDSGANTGPIDIMAYNPTTNTFDFVFRIDGEEVVNFRAIGDKLYAPAVDRRSSADYASGEPWSQKVVGATHSFDMATLDGTDLWLVGSISWDAVAWRSFDGGTTWQISKKAISPVQGSTLYWFMFIGVYKNKAYVQVRDYYAGVPLNHSYVFDGTTWSNGPNLLPDGRGWGIKPSVFADKMVYMGYLPGASSSNYLYMFDGSTARRTQSIAVRDFAINGSELLILRNDGRIQKTTNLTSWTDVSSTSPSGYNSITVLNGTVYVGTTDSKLYRLN